MKIFFNYKEDINVPNFFDNSQPLIEGRNDLFDFAAENGIPLPVDK